MDILSIDEFMESPGAISFEGVEYRIAAFAFRNEQEAHAAGQEFDAATEADEFEKAYEAGKRLLSILVPSFPPEKMERLNTAAIAMVSLHVRLKREQLFHGLVSKSLQDFGAGVRKALDTAINAESDSPKSSAGSLDGIKAVSDGKI